jgi:hypothetical protein
MVSQMTRSASPKKWTTSCLSLDLVDLVLAVGTEHGDFAARVREAVAVAGVRMVLLHDIDFEAVHFVALARLHRHELDIGLEPIERHRERNFLLLAPQRLFGIRMAGMDHDASIRIEARGEEGEAHDMVPVEVGHEEIIGSGMAVGAALQRADPEFAKPASHVADEEGPASSSISTHVVAPP